MSELDSHYGSDPAGTDKAPKVQKDESESGALDKAGEAVKGVADTASRAANKVCETVSDRRTGRRRATNRSPATRPMRAGAVSPS